MLRRIFLLLVLVPLFDLALLAWIVERTSFQLVLALVLGTGLLGVWLARRQGVRSLRRIAADRELGIVPSEALVDGLLVLVAAVLLIIPGFVTDVMAVALLFPPSRRLLKAEARRRFQVRVMTARTATFMPDHDQIIDVHVVDSPPRQLPR